MRKSHWSIVTFTLSGMRRQQSQLEEKKKKKKKEERQRLKETKVQCTCIARALLYTESSLCHLLLIARIVVHGEAVKVDT